MSETMVRVDNDNAFDLIKMSNAANTAIAIHQQACAMFDGTEDASYVMSASAANRILEVVCDNQALSSNERIAAYGAVHYMLCRVLQRQIDAVAEARGDAVVN